MNNEEMNGLLSKAEVLIEALPYIQRFNRKIIVVKYGGSAMADEELQKNVIKDVTLLKLVGLSLSSFMVVVRKSANGLPRLVKRLSLLMDFVLLMLRPWK